PKPLRGGARHTTSRQPGLILPPAWETPMSADDPQIMPQALALMRRQRYDEALPLLQLAASLSPDAPRTVALLGVCLAEPNMLEPALVALRRAVTLDPNNPRAYYNLGTLLERAGKPEEARWTYERALALDPQYEAPQRALSQLPPPPAPVCEAASAAA